MTEFNHAVNPAKREELVALEDGWDGDEASPPSEEAMTILDTVWVVPTANGGWQIEIKFLDHDVEIECSEEGKLASFWMGEL